jgi:hypothetical protein
VIAAYAAEGFTLAARNVLGEWTTITIFPNFVANRGELW